MTAILFAIWGLAAAAADPAPAAATGDAAREARALLRRGEARAAVDRLKAARRADPADREIAILLGAAYLADGNPSWAVRVLDARVTAAPEDCEARAWLARAWLGLGSAEAAARALGEGCADGPWRARFQALAGIAAWAARRDDLARELLAAARQSPEAWPEDRRAIFAFREVLDPERPPPVAWRADAESGWTSDARVGSPVTLEAVDEPASPRLAVAGWMEARGTGRVAPMVELWPRATLFTAEQARRYGGLDLQGRAGARLGPALVALRGGEFLNLEPAAPRPWHQSLRLEGEWEPAPGWLAFAGGGRRLVVEAARSRWELDGGAGWQGAVGPATLLVAGSARLRRANNPEWDDGGGTLTATLRLRRGGWQLWPALAASLDRYPGWTPEPRTDAVLRPGLTAWAPPLGATRAGLALTWTREWSGDPLYDLSVVEVDLRLRSTGVADPGLPRRTRLPEVLPLDWGIRRDPLASGDERVQDLVRQEEQVQGGCGCGG